MYVHTFIFSKEWPKSSDPWNKHTTVVSKPVYMLRYIYTIYVRRLAGRQYNGTTWDQTVSYANKYTTTQLFQ